jgi:hypothetical protein
LNLGSDGYTSVWSESSSSPNRWGEGATGYGNFTVTPGQSLSNDAPYIIEWSYNQNGDKQVKFEAVKVEVEWE